MADIPRDLCMGRRRKRLGPFEVELTRLGKGGVGVGLAPDGAEVSVRGAPPGSRVSVVPMGRKKGRWSARRTAMIRPPVGWAQPPCQVFGLCGGCTLQELTLPHQRAAKLDWVRSLICERNQPRVHPICGANSAVGYRNKVELSFGVRRYLSEKDHRSGLPIAGRFLGFHAAGRFDRVVDTQRCELLGDDANRVLQTLRSQTLSDDNPPPYDPHTHEGFWRHAVLREGKYTGEILLTLYTATGPFAEDVERVAQALMQTSLSHCKLVGVIWAENDGVADVARGSVRSVWGRDELEEKLGALVFRLSPTSFFQTSTEGAVILYDIIGQAAGEAGGLLLDLYCGTGSIGLVLAHRFQRVVGVEEREEAVADARENAGRNGICNAEFHASRVEDALELLGGGEVGVLVVDPPRAGLHPKVARAVARCEAEVLVYVACNPASLARDGDVLAAAGWVMTDLWIVDLFPNTGHVEVVARWKRSVEPEISSGA
jgi:23S rRNA (uracil1939-C5)-methyltransferase